MKRYIIGISLLAFCTGMGLLAGVGRNSATTELRELAVLQPHIDESDYFSQDAFSDKVLPLIQTAVENGADVIVLPEYINVFLAAIPYHKEIQRAERLSQALEYISDDPAAPQSLRELFIRQSGAVRATMDRIYGIAAQKNGIYILAGTYFAADSPSSSPTKTDNTRLTNRAVLYNPAGKAVYEQDKVFLTTWEKERAELDAGNLKAVDGAKIFDFTAGITICRDIFYPVWENFHADRDLWLDLRAEGTQWQQGRHDFTKLLPQRLEGSSSKYGATSALTGSFLDFFWEGRSIMATRKNGDSHIIARADSHNSEDIIIQSLQGDNL